MALQSRVGQVESYDARPRPAANEKVSASPSTRKGKGGTPREGPSSANSPMLKPRQSTSDLMFQMDEETPLQHGDSVKGKAAMRGIRSGDAGSYPESPALGASIPEAESLQDQSFLDEQMSSPGDTILAKSPTELRAITLNQKRTMASPPGLSAPWGSPSISESKKDLKDIMGETSQSRVSNLTLEMSARRESSGNFAPKISQKERKKMQQQQQMQEKLAAQQKAKDGPRNPWQLPPPNAPSTPGKDPLPGQSSPMTPGSEPAKAAQRPAMTMRQTVAGTPPPQSHRDATPVQTQSRSVSAKMPQPSPFSKSSPSGAPTPSQQSLPKTSPQPAIQSVRHIPRPNAQSRSASQGSSSLASILHQQQTEKDEIREAATAKHNLQEIQAEQEFQQWWDQESKRVQGLLDTDDQPREGKSSRGGKSSNASGSSRKRRGNKAPTGPDNSAPGGQNLSTSQGHATPKKKTAGRDPVQPPATPPSTQANAGTSRGSRRGGHGNQRGKGRERV